MVTRVADHEYVFMELVWLSVTPGGPGTLVPRPIPEVFPRIRPESKRKWALGGFLGSLIMNTVLVLLSVTPGGPGDQGSGSPALTCPPVDGELPVYIPDKVCSRFWECSNDCPAVDGEYPVYIPLPNCTQFCQCSNGDAYLHNCPDGLHFNPVLNVCDYPKDAGCQGDGASKTTTESPQDDDSDNGDGNGDGDGDGNGDGDDNGEGDGDDNGNGDGEGDGDGNGDGDDSDRGEPCPLEQPDCPAVDGEHPVYIPLPNCTQFCQCSNGDAYLHNCPDGLHFNPVLNVCDYPTDADCPAVDGEHPVYIPLPNCTQFCQCSNGDAYLHNCPDGLHFNPVLNVCDYPTDAGCQGDGASKTTTESPQDDDSDNGDGNGDGDGDGNGDGDDNGEGDGDDNGNGDGEGDGDGNGDGDDSDRGEPCPLEQPDCPAVDGEHPVYIPLPNCTQFCQCSNGDAYLHNCPDGLHFNPVLNVCDYPTDAGCQGDGASKTTTENCPAVDGEYPVYIPLPNCTQFCQCSNGDAYLHNCPDDLHFNPVLNVCDYPKDAGCQGDGASKTTTESPQDDDSDNGDGNGDGDGDGNGDGDDNGEGDGDDNGNGDGEGDGDGNGDGDDSDRGEPCPLEQPDCPAVDGEHPVYIPLPNCTQFCQCSNGDAYLHNCPDGLHFNPVLNVCDYPTDAECPAVDGEYPVYIPLPDCTQFCQCSNGAAYLHNCSTGLHFNPVLNVCDYPDEAGCNSGVNNVTIQKNTAPEISSKVMSDKLGDDLCLSVVEECPSVDDSVPVYFPLPSCSQFCLCLNGSPRLYNCPIGLQFNAAQNVCDWPENALCKEDDS
ncbi:hypothetical protein NQ318_006227 [Aromia moschata]|uniref:Chitin-binding type-2 domain-containing protein n=1 Tax=Aromia moschata TaxID=1265417 RepID=A0AAV8XVU2_9CUCU|nr:hypothetical protein NQ318_006227 [Aromia moschata]